MKIHISLSAIARKYEERCTFVVANAILEHFGLPELTLEECPTDGLALVQTLRQKGLNYSPIKEPGQDWPMQPRTLRWCLSNLDRTKVYYLFVVGHAMALIKGQLIDTSERPGQRKVMGFEIYRQREVQ